MNGEAQRPPDYFATTRWTVVLNAAGTDPQRAGDSLAQLCQTYWYPLYAYVRRRGYSATDAEDLTQEFFARLLAKSKLAGITREGGKFRSFLLTALNRFLTDEWKRSAACKRGQHATISLDAESAEDRYRLEPVDPLTPERLYEQRWAMALLEKVVQRLQAEYDGDGKGELFAMLKFCITGARSDQPYAELAGRLNMPENTLKTVIRRLRGRYRELLLEEIADTVSTPAEVEEELCALMAAVDG